MPVRERLAAAAIATGPGRAARARDLALQLADIDRFGTCLTYRRRIGGGGVEGRDETDIRRSIRAASP